MIQTTDELYDLSQLNYDSNILNQSLEFVFKYAVNTIVFYDVCVLHDTDCATRFLIDSAILDDTIKTLLERNL